MSDVVVYSSDPFVQDLLSEVIKNSGLIGRNGSCYHVDNNKPMFFIVDADGLSEKKLAEMLETTINKGIKTVVIASFLGFRERILLRRYGVEIVYKPDFYNSLIKILTGAKKTVSEGGNQ